MGVCCKGMNGAWVYVTVCRCMSQSEEEGLKVKQEETGETVQLPDQAGRATAEAGTSLVVPVQNGEGDSLNLSAGFIQVHILLRNYCVDSND